MISRTQFSLKTLLWLMVVVGAFLGGAAWQRAQYDLNVKLWQILLDQECAKQEELEEEVFRLRGQIAKKSGSRTPSDGPQQNHPTQ